MRKSVHSLQRKKKGKIWPEFFLIFIKIFFKRFWAPMFSEKKIIVQLFLNWHGRHKIWKSPFWGKISHVHFFVLIDVQRKNCVPIHFLWKKIIIKVWKRPWEKSTLKDLGFFCCSLWKISDESFFHLKFPRTFWECPQVVILFV